MKTVSGKTIRRAAAGFLLLLLFCAAREACAEELFWRFQHGDERAGWSTRNAQLIGPDRGILTIRGSDPFRVLSPRGLNAGTDAGYLEFRISVPAAGSFGYVLFQTKRGDVFETSYEYRRANAFVTYRISIDEVLPPGAELDSFAFAFGGFSEVKMDYVRVYRPSALAFMMNDLEEFAAVDYININSVNFVRTPSFAGLNFMYIVYGAMTAAVIVVLALRRRMTAAILKQAVLAGCLAGAVVFAGRMDYGWSRQFMKDAGLIFRSHDDRMRVILDERVPVRMKVEDTALDGGFSLYFFAERIREMVPPGETVRIIAGRDFSRLKIRYYLLPVRESRNARYIAVFRDPAASYDPRTLTLLRGGRPLAQNARLVGAAGRDGYLFVTGAEENR